MKRIFPFPLQSWAFGLLLGASLVSARAQIPWATDFFPRQNKTEFYGVGQYFHQGNTTFPGPFDGTPKLKLGDTGLGGFGAAFHFNDFFSVPGDFLLGPANLRAVDPSGASSPFGQNAFLQSGRFNVDYNMINRRLTPFLTAGIGYQFLQVEEDFGDFDHQEFFSQTDFTWNVGGGLRWNVTDNFFIKLTGGAQWLQYQDAGRVTTQIEGFLALGYTFP
jgi:opacity protein-like surface antigen